MSSLASPPTEPRCALTNQFAWLVGQTNQLRDQLVGRQKLVGHVKDAGDSDSGGGAVQEVSMATHALREWFWARLMASPSYHHRNLQSIAEEVVGG